MRIYVVISDIGLQAELYLRPLANVHVLEDLCLHSITRYRQHCEIFSTNKGVFRCALGFFCICDIACHFLLSPDVLVSRQVLGVVTRYHSYVQLT